jgi:N-methylhydantoinase A
VTDAAAVLGYLNPRALLDGEMTLDLAAADAALQGLASRLELSVEDTALAILTVANERMVHSIKDVTVRQGIDPRESMLVAGGGAAGLTIVPIARALGCHRVLIPHTAGALSACGAQYSDIATEFTASGFTTTASFDFEKVNRTLGGLEDALEEFARPLRDSGFSSLSTEFFVDARYEEQVWEIEVKLAGGRFEDDADVEALRASFHDLHHRLFTVSQPGKEIECLQWTGRLSAPRERVGLSRDASTGRVAAIAGERTLAFSGTGHVSASVFHGPELRAGDVVAGPAVIEEPTSTIVLDPESRARVTPFSNYLIDVEGAP